MINFYYFAYSILILFCIFIVGFLVARAPIIRKFYLPTSLVAGLILLVLSPQVMVNLNPEFQIQQSLYDIWKLAPKYLINIVFACLFIAHPLMPIKKLWKMAGPQVAFGQMIAWGQYFVAGILTLVLLVPIFEMPQITASLLEISFEGGHGTVAGLADVFAKFNFEDGRDIANGLATASLISSLVVGLILIHWGKRKGLLKAGGVVKVARNKAYYGQIVHDLHKKGIKMREHLTFKRALSHSFLVVASVAAGYALHGLISLIEDLSWGKTGVKIMPFMPVFTFCMLGGVLVGEVARRAGFKITKEIISLISAIVLTGLIMTAIGTMNLAFFSSKGEVFLALYLVGAVWIIFCFLFLAKRMFREYWFQNAIVSFGQSMGMTATGLLFAQMVDPKNRTNAVESFGYKQLLFEPLMGGGIVTALSMPIIMIIGLPVFTLICGVITFGWMMFGIFKFGRRR